MAGVLVVMGVIVLVAGLNADKIKDQRSHASLGLHAVGKRLQLTREPLQHDVFEGAAVVKRHGRSRDDQIMVRVLPVRQAARQSADPTIVDI